MIKKFLSGCTLVFLLISCNHIYREYEKEAFRTFSWKAGKEIVFSPSIRDISRPYELTLGIRHVYGAKIKRMNIVVKIISPSGMATTKAYSFNVMNAKGESLASCAGDLCDLETVVDNNLRFDEAGDYEFIVSHAGKESMSGIMEFGMIIRENE